MEITKMSSTYNKTTGLAGEKTEETVGFKPRNCFLYGF